MRLFWLREGANITPFFVISLTTLVLLSCHNPDIQNFSYKLKPVKTLKFKLDETSTYKPDNIFFFEGNKHKYLAVAQPYAFKIDLYDYDSKQLAHTYFIDKHNKFELKDVASLYIPSLDSVYIFFRNYRMALVDRDSIIKVINLPTETLGEHMVHYPGRTYRPIILLQKTNQLFISIIPFGGYYGKNYWKVPLGVAYNLTTDKFSFFKSPPKSYLNRVHSTFYEHYSVTMNDKNELIYSFGFDPNLLVYNLDDSTMQQKDAHSVFFKDVPDSEGNPLELDDEKFYVESNSYKEIFYDKWRQVYYRVAYRGVDIQRKDGARRTWYDKKPSIIILDKDFKKLGETPLKADFFFFQNSFVSEDGLNISTNHDLNPQLDEDYLSFVLFKLVEK